MRCVDDIYREWKCKKKKNTNCKNNETRDVNTKHKKNEREIKRKKKTGEKIQKKMAAK